MALERRALLVSSGSAVRNARVTPSRKASYASQSRLRQHPHQRLKVAARYAFGRVRAARALRALCLHDLRP